MACYPTFEYTEGYIFLKSFVEQTLKEGTDVPPAHWQKNELIVE